MSETRQYHHIGDRPPAPAGRTTRRFVQEGAPSARPDPEISARSAGEGSRRPGRDEPPRANPRRRRADDQETLARASGWYFGTLARASGRRPGGRRLVTSAFIEFLIDVDSRPPTPRRASERRAGDQARFGLGAGSMGTPSGVSRSSRRNRRRTNPGAGSDQRRRGVRRFTAGPRGRSRPIPTACR